MNTVLIAAGIGQGLAALLMFVASLFLILLVLVQRGKGGGLSGAFGGMGGSSAFGAKAGDTFTRITIVASAVWILICMISVWALGNSKPNDTILTEGRVETRVVEPETGSTESEPFDLSDLEAGTAPAGTAPAADSTDAEGEAATPSDEEAVESALESATPNDDK